MHHMHTHTHTPTPAHTHINTNTTQNPIPTYIVRPPVHSTHLNGNVVFVLILFVSRMTIISILQFKNSALLTRRNYGRVTYLCHFLFSRLLALSSRAAMICPGIPSRVRLGLI